MSLKYQTEDEARVDDPNLARAETIPQPIPYYTIFLIVAILIVAAVQFGTGLIASIEAAGFDKRAFSGRHEYWRILTGATVHGSLLHVGMNCYAFYSFGKIFEMLSNRAHLAIVVPAFRDRWRRS
jgi:membrane associated rhomboid family serine protease